MKKIVVLLFSLMNSIIGFTQCSIIVTPNNITANNDVGICGALLNYTLPYVVDTCTSGFYEDFESGYQGWTIGAYTSVENWTIQDYTGTGTMLNSNMVGVPHSGNYSYGGTEHSYIQSPIFNTNGGGIISFDYFVNNEPAFHDKEVIEISYDGGSTWNQIAGDQLTNNATTIQTFNFNVSAINGSTNTIIKFTYNTVDACCGAQDGFFIDNVKFEPDVSIQQISGLGSGAEFPIGTTTESYEIIKNGISDTVSFTVTINSTYNMSQSFSICQGESISIGSNTYTISGNYVDTLATQNGCDSIVTTALTVKPPIDTTLLVNNNIISSNEYNASYQWINYSTGNSFISGETNQEFVANNNGFYAVIINQNGCTKISEAVEIISTGITNNSSSNIEIQVYPNPTTEKVFVSMKNSNNVISLLDLTGKEIYNKNIGSNKTEIDLSNYSSGTYLLRVFNNEKSETIRIIKN